MYGDAGYKLVQHAKRMQHLPNLPGHQSELVRTITREVRDLDRNASALLLPYGGSFDPSSEPATACSLLVDHLAMRRNKRCLLAYHRVRASKLEEMCWTGGPILERHTRAWQPQENMQSEHYEQVRDSSALSPEEEEFMRVYSEILAGLKGQWTDIDLTGSLEPPKDLFIDVRVLKDAGEIQTEYG